MSKTYKNIFLVSFFTVGSRILGLLRDVALLAVLGTSLLSSAFVFAFTIPNLFRRLLGEGALTSALVPVFSSELERKQHSGAYFFLNQIFSWLLLVLVLLVGGLVVTVYGFSRLKGLEERWYYAFDFSMVLAPYLLLVCLAAIFSAVLNVLNRFWESSLSQVWLNLSIIGAIFFAEFFFGGKPGKGYVYFICTGVLLGGFIQVLVPAMALGRLGWRPRIDFRVSSELKGLVKLFLPGVLGAAILQLNVVISRFLAFSIDDKSGSILYLANRLLEFPLGVFTISVATVFFPRMALFLARSENSLAGKEYLKGLRLIFSITLPAAFGLCILSEPIINLLFKWKEFEANDISLCVPIVSLFALGLPFYSLAMFSTRAFHSMKDMRTPFYFSLVFILINLGISWLGIELWKTKGLALASVLTVALQSFLLQYSLGKKDCAFAFVSLWSSVWKVLFACVVMSFFTYYFKLVFMSGLNLSKINYFLLLFLDIGISIGVYFLILWRLKFEELSFFTKYLFRASSSG